MLSTQETVEVVDGDRIAAALEHLHEHLAYYELGGGSFVAHGVSVHAEFPYADVTATTHKDKRCFHMPGTRRLYIDRRYAGAWHVEPYFSDPDAVSTVMTATVPAGAVELGGDGDG
jgi:hypothetical protein